MLRFKDLEPKDLEFRFQAFEFRLDAFVQEGERRRTERVGHRLQREREFVIDNLLVRNHFFIEMIRWTGLAPWDCEFPFPGSLISMFLGLGFRV